MSAPAAGELRVEDVTHWLGDSEQPVLAGVDLRVRGGETVALLGPSGSGKSTLGHLMAGYASPAAGTITVDGRRVTGPSTDVLLLFQENALMPWLTTFDNVMFGPRARGEGADAVAAAEALLADMGLREFRDRYPRELSGGMRRRAELARALVNDPRVLILDEPFRGLDAMTRELMQEYTARILLEHRRTAVFITTDVDEAVLLADRVVVLGPRPGHVVADLAVDLPHPRDRVDLLTDPVAVAAKQAVLEATESDGGAVLTRKEAR